MIMTHQLQKVYGNEITTQVDISIAISTLHSRTGQCIHIPSGRNLVLNLQLRVEPSVQFESEIDGA